MINQYQASLPMKTLESLARRFTVVIALAALSLSTVAADQTWNGGANNQWTTTANWSGNALPGGTDAVIYNNLSTGHLSNWLAQAFSIKDLVVSNVPGPVSINSSANTLTLTPSFLNSSNPPVAINLSNATYSLTVAASVALGTNQSWYVTNGQTLSIPGAVSGGAGLYKDGLGTLFLNGTNTFTGNFTNNGGPVWINNGSALGTASKSIWIANNLAGAGLHLNGTNGSIVLPAGLQFNVSQSSGAIFNEAGSNVINGNMYVQSGGGLAYIVANAGTLVLNGPIGLSVSARPFQVGGAGNGIINGAIGNSALPFTKTDSGTWTLTNHNAYGGATVIQGGTLVLSTNATIASTPSITLLSNAVFDVSAVSNATYGSNVFALSPSTTVQTLAGNGTVNGNVVCVNAAFIVPGGSNAVGTLTVTTNLILNGAVAVPFELNTATTPGGGINDLVNVGGKLDPQGAAINVTPLSLLTSGGTYRLFNYGTESANPFNPTVTTDTRCAFVLTDSGTSPGHIDLNVTGSNSNLVWSGDNNGAAWDVNSTANWDGDTQTFYNSDAVTFDDSSANNTVSITATVRPVSVNVTNNTASYLFQGAGKITGVTGLTKSGAGLLVISNTASDYTGPVVVNGGTLSVNAVANGGTASELGAGTTITLNGGTFRFTGPRPAATSFNRTWFLDVNGGTVLSTNGVFFLQNQISGPGSLTKTGSVQVILGDINTGVLSTGASNIYSGNTYITQGELQIRNNHALGFGKAVVSNGADLAVGGGVNYGAFTNNIDLNGDGPSSAGALQVNDANSQATFAGTINLVTSATVGVFAGATGFTISGPIIGAGMLKKGSHAACTVTLTCPANSYSGGTLITGGTLQLGDGSVAGSLGSGAVTNNGTLSYDHSDLVTNSLAMSGTGALIQSGAGTLVLSGSSMCSGATTVSAGTLLVNGSLGTNTVTVAGGATLGGYGMIGGG